MAKGALTVVNENAERQVRRKNQFLKATNKKVLPDSNLDKQDQKVFKGKKNLTKAAEKVEVAEKENTPILRRSKRKVVAVSAVKLNADSPLTSKTSKSNTKNIQSLKTRSKIALKLTKEYSTTVINEIPDKTQSNSNASPVASNQHASESSKSVNSNLLNTPSMVSDDSGFESSTRVSDQSTATLSYWMELAEQRRIALEAALHENELLHDQLAVLEAENSQLKQLIKEAEELAEVLEDSDFVK